MQKLETGNLEVRSSSCFTNNLMFKLSKIKTCLDPEQQRALYEFLKERLEPQDEPAEPETLTVDGTDTCGSVSVTKDKDGDLVVETFAEHVYMSPSQLKQVYDWAVSKGLIQAEPETEDKTITVEIPAYDGFEPKVLSLGKGPCGVTMDIHTPATGESTFLSSKQFDHILTAVAKYR